MTTHHSKCKAALHAITQTTTCSSLLVIRVALGGFMLVHGLQKAFGLFGGPGFEGALGWLTGSIGLPWFIALSVVLIETIGAVALITGLGVRINAVLTAIVLGGAIYTVHFANGYFDFELHLLGIAISLALLIEGAGAYSLDRLIAERTA